MIIKQVLFILSIKRMTVSRIIRRAGGYGAILLCDNRLANNRAIKNSRKILVNHFRYLAMMTIYIYQ